MSTTPAVTESSRERRPSAGAELARGSFVNLVATLASNLRGLFTFLVARLLGEAVLGTYALAWSSVDLISKVGNFGLDGATTALVARHEAIGDVATSRRIFTHALFWGTLFSAVTAVIAIASLRWLGHDSDHPELMSCTAVLMLALPGMMLYRVGTGASRGKRVMRHDVYSRGLSEPIATIAALALAVALGLTTRAPVAAVLFGTLVAGVVAVMLARTLFPAGSTVSSVAVDGPLLSFAAPLAITSLLNTLIMRMDVLLLGAFVTRAAGVSLATLGIFAAAVDVAAFMRKLRQVFDPIFMPVVASQLAVGDRDGARHSFAQLGRWVLALQLLVVGVLWVSGGLILSVLGANFRQGAPWLAILALAHATNTFVGLGETLILVQRPILNTVNSGITAVVQLAVSLPLIRFFGPTGAALGMLIAFTTQGLLRFLELRWLFAWSIPWSAFARPCAAFATALAPAVVIRLACGSGAGELWAGIAFISLYLAIGWRMGLDDADRATLHEMRRRQARN